MVNFFPRLRDHREIPVVSVLLQYEEMTGHGSLRILFREFGLQRLGLAERSLGKVNMVNVSGGGCRLGKRGDCKQTQRHYSNDNFIDVLFSGNFRCGKLGPEKEDAVGLVGMGSEE